MRLTAERSLVATRTAGRKASLPGVVIAAYRTANACPMQRADTLSRMTDRPTSMPPIPVLIVASWYPGVDDPARGRFVADQAEALAATGRARPIVVSFEGARVDGDQLDRLRALGLVERHRALAFAEHPNVVNARAWGLSDRIPTARLPILAGMGRATPPGSDGDVRREALLELADLLDVTDGPRGVVHAHTGYPDGFAASGLAERLGWPLVVTEHASFVARQLRQPEERRRYLEAVDAARAYLAVSDVLAGELLQAIPRLEGKLEVMPNTVPLDQYEATGPEQRSPEELIFVGYRKPTKGIATLLRAFADVHEARPGATLRLIGRSPTPAQEEVWKEMARDLGIEGVVHFDPPTDRRGIATAMRHASILVHPSPRETFGMTTLEALASGMPVVATRSGGISHVLEDGRLGELVPPHDSRALARAVLRTLDRRDSFDPAVLRQAVVPYSAEVVGGRLVDLYQRLTADGVAVEPDGRGTRSAAATGARVEVPGRLLVVGYDTRATAILLRDAPADLLGRLILVTSGDDEEVPLPAGLGSVVRADVEIRRELDKIGLLGPRGTIVNRLRRVVRNPFAAILRRVWLGRHNLLRTQAIVAGMRTSLQASDAVRALMAGGPAPVVCVDAVDHEAVAAWIAEGRLRPIPGGIMWLADAWTAAQAADDGTPSRSSTASASLSPTTAQS